MHFITMGTVDVMSEDGEVVYETLREGDYFGEMCCLCGTPSLVSFKYVYSTYPKPSHFSDILIVATYISKSQLDW